MKREQPGLATAWAPELENVPDSELGAKIISTQAVTRYLNTREPIYKLAATKGITAFSQSEARRALETILRDQGLDPTLLSDARATYVLAKAREQRVKVAGVTKDDFRTCIEGLDIKTVRDVPPTVTFKHEQFSTSFLESHFNVQLTDLIQARQERAGEAQKKGELTRDMVHLYLKRLREANRGKELKELMSTPNPGVPGMEEFTTLSRLLFDWSKQFKQRPMLTDLLNWLAKG